ncbi:XylR family transcriptional regulator [Photobacterium rosenbergii]|uniref:XylR family transcriptional regulator n=1 Tax=Photobacterium rosenbergii TaxID=294936 RepID=A0A2T3N9S7_9GAMM|nr:DNA-binding transcriptional regulator [Photobacterium rosenbergii]PSW10286.1 XylR family transcriptional regulator [Photobacterium rosenbergii]
MRKKPYRIALLFNANKVYDRDIISGIGEYIHASNASWDVYIEDDFVIAKDVISHWSGDGIIADFDDLELAKTLLRKDMPIVGIGSSYHDERMYPEIPYVATDNDSVVELAYKHLKDKGITQFAFYGLPDVESKLWSYEREQAFKRLMKKYGHDHWVYRGLRSSSKTWEYSMHRLSDWVKQLPKGTGIIAVTDARARHLLQVCDNSDIIVPDDLAIIGVDNERVARHLTRVSLSSVEHSCRKMGFNACKMLHKKLEGGEIKNSRIVVPATRIFERQSSSYQAIQDPSVIKSLHYIRTHIKDGIKVYHVLDELRLSRSNLEMRFKNELGHTIHHEIHNTRLNMACSILSSTEIPISDVFSMCGYPSLQYMYSVFSKNMGMTPKEYRKAKLSNEAL